MKRILQIGLSENLGGIESYLYNQANALDHTKLIYDFLCYRGTNHIPHEKELIAQGSCIHHLTIRRRYIFPYYQQFIKILRENNYQGIVLNAITLDNVSLLLVAKFFRVPIRVIHSHNGGFEAKKLSLKARVLQRINKVLLKLSVTDYFACSHLAGEWLFGKGVFCKIVPNAIFVDAYRFSKQKRQQARAKMNLGDAFVVGHVARMARQKNQGFLIDIFYEIYKKKKNAILLFIGAADEQRIYYREIQEKIEAYGLQDNVKLLGIRYDVPELMQAMDCFVLPSLFEGLPVVGVEAQAAGLPCYFADTITKEVDITGIVTYNSLEDSPAKWAEHILKNEKIEREKMADIVADAGYDVHVVAHRLQKYYLQETEKSLTGGCNSTRTGQFMHKALWNVETFGGVAA